MEDDKPRKKIKFYYTVFGGDTDEGVPDGADVRKCIDIHISYLGNAKRFFLVDSRRYELGAEVVGA